MSGIRYRWQSLQMLAGSALGYSRAQHALSAALEEAGGINDPDARMVVHFTTPMVFRPIPGRLNVLYCLAPETRVLTADLRWVPVADLRPGDNLVGFDEQLGRQNKWRRSLVEGVSRLRAPGYRIRTTEGEVVASANHQWVIRRGTKRLWCRTDELRPETDSIVRWHGPWESGVSYDDGWMAGFLDGEGFVSGGNGLGNCVGFTQLPGPTLDRACAILRARGFTFNCTRNKANGTISVQIHRGVRALGLFRPSRLLPKADRLWDGRRTWSGRNPMAAGEVLSVESIGEVELIGTKTSTATLVAEGFLSHNTMNESAWPAPWFTRGLRKADVVIVPTEWNAAVIRRVWGGPVYVAPLGVYPEFFAGVKRERPKGKPFRFLWLGAHNDRKGWRDVLEAWKAAFQFSPKVELYIKTTPNPGNTEPIAVRRHGNIAIDNRVVPEEELYKLYVEADCFVFPSWGEGWGLPLLEAMATALPCIAGCWTGMTAFADPTVVRPLRSQARLVAVRDVPNSDWLEYEPMMTPDHASVVETMRWVLTHWAKAQAMGRRACERAQGFTWSAAGQRLRDVLLEIDARAG